MACAARKAPSPGAAAPVHYSRGWRCLYAGTAGALPPFRRVFLPIVDSMMQWTGALGSGDRQRARDFHPRGCGHAARGGVARKGLGAPVILVLVALLLTACGHSASTAQVTPTAVSAAATATPTLRPTATAAAPTPTSEPPAAALGGLTRAIDEATADADRQNTAIEDRLNAGTTLAPLVPALNAAVTADARAAAAVSSITLPQSIASYRAAQQYQAGVAAGYGTLADAWAALARAAQGSGDETTYQTLAGQATDRFRAAALAKDQAAITAGLAPEGSAPD